MCISTIGVVGAGVMGSDIALDLASYKKKIILRDISRAVLQKTEENIKKNFQLVKMMKSEMRNLTIDNIMENITFTTEYKGFENVEMVIENITEEFEKKREEYQRLREVCSDDTIFAVNTSCISITKMGALMKKPENVLGMHFMNPVPLKKMVEVIRGYYTSKETISTSKAFLKSFNKTSIVVNDFPGFITNRVLMLTINECIWAYQDNVAGSKEIDKIFRLGFGHKMGPLATADLIGLDTILNSLIVLFESYNDPKYRPCPLLRKMVDAGLLGKKSGKGFFEYNMEG